MSCSIDTETDNKVHSSEDYLENAIDYQADCDDLFHEGDDDSDNTLDYKLMGRISTVKEKSISLMHNVYQCLNKEVMQVYTNFK